MSRRLPRIRSRHGKAPPSARPPDDGGWRQTFVLLFAIVVLTGALAVGSISKTVSHWEARAEGVPAPTGGASPGRRTVATP